MSVTCEVISKRVFVIIDLYWNWPSGPNCCNCHLVHCQSSCLVWTNVVSTSHDFTRSQSLNEVFIDKHSSDWVSEWDHDCKGKTFWHGDDNNCDTDNEVSDPLWAISLQGACGIQVFYWGIVFTTSEQVELSNYESFNEESEEECVDCQESAIHTNFAYVTSNSLQFLLKGSCFYFLLKDTDNSTLATVVSYNNSQEPTVTSSDLGTRQQDWRRQIMRSFVSVLSICILSIFFFLS